jgi:hypothetical protein
LFNKHFSFFYFDFLNRTKEIGESSKAILQKKTNKSSNQRSSTTLNTSKQQQRTTINPEHHLSPNNNQSALSERSLRFFYFLFLNLFSFVY